MLQTFVLIAATLTLTPQNTEVVVADDASRATQIAAQEATNFLSRVFGADIPVVRGKGTPGKTPIRLDGRLEGLSRDAFRITAGPTGVVIAGRDSDAKDPESIIKLPGEQEWGPQYERATLFGVYEFLERFVGCRFYFPGELGEIVPRKASVDVPEGMFEVKPDWTVRRYGYSDGRVPEDVLGEFRAQGAAIEPPPERWGGLTPTEKTVKRWHFYRLRMETEYLPFCHGLHKMRMVRRFGKAHPEYFQLRKDGTRSLDWERNKYSGAFCYSSAITNEVYEDIKAYLQGRPVIERYAPEKMKRWPLAYHDRIIDVMPHDGMTPCQCEACQEAYAAEPNKRQYATELLWTFTAGLAKRLEADGFTDFRLTQMAYNPYGGVPKVDIPESVRVMVAKNGPYSIVNDGISARDLKAIAAWGTKTGGRVWLWNYPGKAMKLGIKGPPSHCPRAWGRYYQSVAPYVFGAFAESETDRWIFHYLNYYVFAKVCWDNKVDVDELLREHHRLMFGAAAPVMSNLFDTFEDKWLKVAGNVVETELGPLNAPPTEKEIWEGLYSRTELAQMAAEFDAAEKMLPADSLEARRVRFFKKEFLGPVRAASEKYGAMIDAIKALSNVGNGSLDLKPLKYGHTCPPALDGSVTLCRTDKDLIVEYRVAEPKMDKRVVRERPYDQSAAFGDDCIEFVLNPSGDRKTFFQFGATSAGAWVDARGRKDGKSTNGFTTDWNSGATVKVTREASGWRARFEIPLASLGEVKPTFPANFARFRNVEGGGNGYYSWNPFLRELRDIDMFATVTPRKD